MKIDLHLHSVYSWDSKVPIRLYIKKAENKGFGAISIADHNNNKSHNVIKKLQKETSVILIPGQEIDTLDGHLLIYGWIPLLDRDMSMVETVRIAHELANTHGSPIKCVAAHPFDKLRKGKGKTVLDTGIDGFETINASTLLPNFIYTAKRYGNKYKDKLFTVGNSDAHRISEFGVAYTEIPSANSIDEVLENLIHAQAKGKRIGVFPKINRFLRRKFGFMTE